MPNIITHYLFATSVKKKLNNEEVLNAIKEYPQEYTIGSNGPDFLFFYHFFSKSEEYGKVRKIGNELHGGYINKFYEMALNAYRQERDEDVRQAMLSYLAGHLCHWALDSTTHPYIFYRTGDCHGKSASMHHRFESMMDAMMLKNLLDTDIRKFPYYSLARSGLISDRVISNIYEPVARELFQVQLGKSEIRDCLAEWERILKLTYDPKGWKAKVVGLYEKKVNHPYLYRGNIVPASIDPTYDVLNEKKMEWNYPVDEARKSNASFMELFNEAIDLAIDCINAIYDEDKLMNLLDDKTYDMGVSGNREMVSFDLIYKDQ